MSKTAKDKQKLLDELKKTPIVQVACKRSCVGRATYYRWRKSDKDFAEAADEQLFAGAQLVNDMAESQLIAGIKEQNMTAIIFWLKHHQQAYETRVKVSGKLQHETEELNPEQAAMVLRTLKFLGGNTDER